MLRKSRTWSTGTDAEKHPPFAGFGFKNQDSAKRKAILRDRLGLEEPALTLTIAPAPIRVSEAAIPARLARLIGAAKYKLWFGSSRFRLDEDGLEVSVPNRFVADWIDHHYHDELLGLAESDMGPGAAVRLRVAPGETQPLPLPTMTPPAESRPMAPTDNAPRRALEVRHDLTDFVVGPCNELAYAAATRMAEDQQDASSILFVHGGCGLGKTHLLQGLCRRYAERRPEARWLYTTAEQFTNRYIQAVRSNRVAEFRRRLRRLDLLAIDDVHFLSNKTATQSEFLHTFDAIGLVGARIVMASDAHPKQIRRLSEALTSRFLSGMVVRIDTPEGPTRVRILAALAHRKGLRLREGVAEVIAERCDGSIREAEGTLTKLAALARLERHEADAPIGRGMVDRLTAAEATRRPTQRPVRTEQILQTVCRHLGIERSQAMSRSRHRRVVLARSMTAYLARQLTTLSYPELARALGRPNHSTVVTATQRMEKQIRECAPVPLIDPGGAPTMDRLAEQLRRRVLEDAENAK